MPPVINRLIYWRLSYAIKHEDIIRCLVISTTKCPLTTVKALKATQSTNHKQLPGLILSSSTAGFNDVSSNHYTNNVMSVPYAEKVMRNLHNCISDTGIRIYDIHSTPVEPARLQWLVWYISSWLNILNCKAGQLNC